MGVSTERISIFGWTVSLNSLDVTTVPFLRQFILPNHIMLQWLKLLCQRMHVNHLTSLYLNRQIHYFASKTHNTWTIMASGINTGLQCILCFIQWVYIHLQTIKDFCHIVVDNDLQSKWAVENFETWIVGHLISWTLLMLYRNNLPIDFQESMVLSFINITLQKYIYSERAL